MPRRRVRTRPVVRFVERPRPPRAWIWAGFAGSTLAGALATMLVTGGEEPATVAGATMSPALVQDLVDEYMSEEYFGDLDVQEPGWEVEPLPEEPAEESGPAPTDLLPDGTVEPAATEWTIADDGAAGAAVQVPIEVPVEVPVAVPVPIEVPVEVPVAAAVPEVPVETVLMAAEPAREPEEVGLPERIEAPVDDVLVLPAGAAERAVPVEPVEPAEPYGVLVADSGSLDGQPIGPLDREYGETWTIGTTGSGGGPGLVEGASASVF